MTRAIFTDKDGVLNKLIPGKVSPRYRSQLEFFPLIKEGVELAHRQGYKIFVVTNQPDTGDDMRDYTDKLLRYTFEFDDVVMALQRGSWDYKPNPGMIEFLTEKYNIDLSKSWMIGDTWKDAVCARLGYVHYVHVGYSDPIAPVDFTADSFYNAIRFIEENKIVD